MDKYEFQIKTEQLEKQLDRKNYETAAKIADSIDWRKVRNVGLLMEVAEAYEYTERYEDSYEILNIAYDCAPIGRMIVYKMAELAVKMEDYDEAVDLYKEFVKIAPHDLGRYVLKYKIYKGRGAAIEDQIAILEEYKSREYQEQWAYELAELYYQDGQLSKCVEECDDLILWFSEGEYVRKAMELKMKIQPLTASQEEKYRQMVGEERAKDIEIRPVNMEDKFNTVNLQAALAEGVQDYIEEELHHEEQAEELNPEEPEKELPTAPEEVPEVREAQQFEAVDPDKLLREKKEPSEPVKPSGFLGQTDTGQITFDPDESVVEKQITGQMNIEDILAEWERKKKENLEKREEEVRQHVLQQTGAMFTEFEQAVRDGLLEKLEKEKAADTADTVAEDTTDTDEVEELEEITEEPATEEPVEELTEAAPVEEAEQEPVEELPEEDTVEELAEEPAYEPEAEEFEEPEAEIYEQEEIVDEEQAEPEEAMDDEPVEEPTAEAVESVDEETASEEIELTAEETPEAGEAPEQPERPAVERDKAKVRALTREERELYAPFIQSRSAREQLVKAIDNISLAAYTGNVIITGEEGMDTLSLAKNMVREIQATDSNFSGKVAKISGHALNKKDTADTLSKLKNGALIICKASEMNDATANVLHKALQQESQGIVIILEDTKRDIDKFLEKHEKLRECFTARMDVEALSNNTLVAFGKQYAREMEYSIDELGELALHTRIEDMQTIDHVVTVVDVKQIVDEAIAHANKKTLKHFFDVLFAKRYDDEDMIILTEKDFV